ncbi:hypothetical protein Ssi03_75380 [Sphaerisporangium siamense]|nr:hypothetical protein Ssi03_75380 [Sphaerisporangium siamense]
MTRTTRFGLIAVAAGFLLVTAPAAASAQSWDDSAVEQEAPGRPAGDQETYGPVYNLPLLPLLPLTTDAEEFEPDLSFDGRTIVFTSNRYGVDDLF